VFGDLHTPRLHLRTLSRADERLYCSLYTDAGVMRHVTEPLTPEAAQRAFQAVLRQMAVVPAQSCYWILAPRAGGDDFGVMALVPDHGGAESAEVGVLLVGSAECRGYATESIAALADAVFAGPAQQRLWTRHARDNAAVVALMHKLGFESLEEAGAGPAPLRWQLERQAWAARRLPVFAS
jgi:RimJ/RimL family protein N-acetyltransferase